MSGIRTPADYLKESEIEYLEKVGWLWYHLSFSQRSKIVHSINDGTLCQGSEKHCFIAEAMSVNNVKTPITNPSLFNKIVRVVNYIFYEGPSYDFLFDKKISIDDRNKLNDIYYAKIGKTYHQYQKATELLKTHVTNLPIAIK